MISSISKSKHFVKSVFRVPYKALHGQKLVWIDEGRVSGEPLFFGTRVPISIFLDHLENEQLPEFFKGYPSVSKDQVIGLMSFLTKANRSHRQLAR